MDLDANCPMSVYLCLIDINILKEEQKSRKWLTVAIFQKWQYSSVALRIEIAVILNWRYRLGIWYGLVWFGMV